jgi:hypothetical protein
MVQCLRDNVFRSRCGEEECLIGVEDKVTKILSKVGVHDSSVTIVCDTTTIHGLTNKISEGIPRKIFFVVLHSLIQIK